MLECNTVSTPLEPNIKLLKPTNEADAEELKLSYKELIGALTYLAQETRPDISFSVNYLSQFNNCYRREHWNAAKRVLTYWKGTINFEILTDLKNYRSRDMSTLIRDTRYMTDDRIQAIDLYCLVD